MSSTTTADPTGTDGLLGWLQGRGVPFDGTPELTLIAGGRSNLTYKISDGAGHDYVLRRPPMGELLQSAHDVAREHRIISALAGTDVPVPAARGVCEDPAVFGGAPFYVMDLVPGVVLNTAADGAAFPADVRPAATADLVRVLAAVHGIDPDAVGLGDLGRREDYSSRQLRRWLRQFHASRTREIPLVEQVHDRLAASVPPQRYTGLVHGDYRVGNVLLSPTGTVNAVLDWELATLGDTMADLGWLLATWYEPGEQQVFESPTGAPGFGTRSELAATYARITGHDVSAAPWYRAFALWRLTCICEGIYARYRTGKMGDDGFDVDAQGRQVIALAEAAAAALDES
ncbi:phosphotransferase [Nakamurella sp. YIM 132087]|uniref:Phosphotransferase n=1 Tax=Nakamurella alba TaxID=2665158 RepID=A0A7K1FPA1_9ACTN|nr:phosphotransferase family protein [Nakamurella alba]MTD15975.1 phosphotransferase [Nakamurella alba]